MTDKFSYSKQAFVDLIQETLVYINTTNNEHTSIQELGQYFLEKKLINENIYELLENKEYKLCNAMTKKGKERCSNKITSEQFCLLHINNPPDITWSDYKRLQNLKNLNTLLPPD